MTTRRPHRPSARLHRRPGFTMVELLVVIGIIVVLVGILVPAVTGVRKSALRAATQSRMAAIAAACQNYFSDFRAYPGPLRNDQVMGSTQPQGTPSILRRNGGTFPFSGGDGVSPKEVTQSENLVLGLMGGLVVKFRPVSGTLDIASFTYDRNTVGGGPQSLTAVAESRRNKPTYLSESQWLSDRAATSDIPHGKGSAIPEFVDSQGVPILYLRANVGAPVGNTGQQAGISGDNTLQYNYTHLMPYANKAATANDFKKKAGGAFTPQDFIYNSLNDVSYLRSPSSGARDAGGKFLDGTPTNPWQPRGKDAFILLSAGIDGFYGTEDDIFHPQ